MLPTSEKILNHGRRILRTIASPPAMVATWTTAAAMWQSMSVMVASRSLVFGVKSLIRLPDAALLGLHKSGGPSPWSFSLLGHT